MFFYNIEDIRYDFQKSLNGYNKNLIFKEFKKQHLFNKYILVLPTSELLYNHYPIFFHNHSQLKFLSKIINYEGNSLDEICQNILKSLFPYVHYIQDLEIKITSNYFIHIHFKKATRLIKVPIFQYIDKELLSKMNQEYFDYPIHHFGKNIPLELDKLCFKSKKNNVNIICKDQSTWAHNLTNNLIHKNNLYFIPYLYEEKNLIDRIFFVQNDHYINESLLKSYLKNQESHILTSLLSNLLDFDNNLYQNSKEDLIHLKQHIKKLGYLDCKIFKHTIKKNDKINIYYYINYGSKYHLNNFYIDGKLQKKFFNNLTKNDIKEIYNLGTIKYIKYGNQYDIYSYSDDDDSKKLNKLIFFNFYKYVDLSILYKLASLIGLNLQSCVNLQEQLNIFVSILNQFIDQDIKHSVSFNKGLNVFLSARPKNKEQKLYQLQNFISIDPMKGTGKLKFFEYNLNNLFKLFNKILFTILLELKIVEIFNISQNIGKILNIFGLSLDTSGKTLFFLFNNIFQIYIKINLSSYRLYDFLKCISSKQLDQLYKYIQNISISGGIKYSNFKNFSITPGINLESNNDVIYNEKNDIEITNSSDINLDLELSFLLYKDFFNHLGIISDTKYYLFSKVVSNELKFGYNYKFLNTHISHTFLGKYNYIYNYDDVIKKDILKNYHTLFFNDFNNIKCIMNYRYSQGHKIYDLSKFIGLDNIFVLHQGQLFQINLINTICNRLILNLGMIQMLFFTLGQKFYNFCIFIGIGIGLQIDLKKLEFIFNTNLWDFGVIRDYQVYHEVSASV